MASPSFGGAGWRIVWCKSDGLVDVGLLDRAQRVWGTTVFMINLSQGSAEVRPAGWEPTDQVNPAVASVASAAHDTDSEELMSVRIVPLVEAHWREVSAIYAEGIATGHATFESEPPDWAHFDAGRLPDHRYVALDRKSTRLNSSHYGLSRMPSSA